MCLKEDYGIQVNIVVYAFPGDLIIRLKLNGSIILYIFYIIFRMFYVSFRRLANELAYLICFLFSIKQDNYLKTNMNSVNKY